jgi:hypothetical protein
MWLAAPKAEERECFMEQQTQNNAKDKKRIPVRNPEDIDAGDFGLDREDIYEKDKDMDGRMSMARYPQRDLDQQYQKHQGKREDFTDAPGSKRNTANDNTEYEEEDHLIFSNKKDEEHKEENYYRDLEEEEYAGEDEDDHDFHSER